MFRVKNFALTPVLALRLGLSLVFIYAALHMLLDPQNWLGFVPNWIGKLIDPKLFLTIHSIFELLLGLAILFGWFLEPASLIAALDLAAIIVFFGVDDITFRDFGLVMAAVALFLLATQKNKGPEN